MRGRVTTLNFIWALRFQKVVLIEKSSSLLCSEKGLTIDDCSALKIRTTSTIPHDSRKNGGWFPYLLASRKCQVSFLFFETFLINGHLPYNHSLNKIISLIVLGFLSFTQILAGPDREVRWSARSLRQHFLWNICEQVPCATEEVSQKMAGIRPEKDNNW